MTLRAFLPVFLIFFIGFVLRIVGLSSLPSGFTPDEASFGYDAYSILHTGRDQWGKLLPLTLESFGDNKLPLYSYLTIPSIALFGLTEFAVRLPNAVLGSIAILATYVFVYQFFADKRVAFVSALFLAFSPWHIPLSRGAFEANLTTFFMPVGLAFLLYSQKKKYFSILSSFFLGLNLFTYHSARILTPVIIFLFIFFFSKKLQQIPRKYLYTSAFLFFILFVISLFGYAQGGSSRLASSSIFSWAREAGERRVDLVISGMPIILSRLFYNPATEFFSRFLKQYFTYLSPQFLLTSGPAEATYGMVPGQAVLSPVEFFCVILSFAYFFKKQRNEFFFLGLCVLLAFVPSALTLGPGYAANRAAFALPFIQITGGLGAVFLYDLSRKYKFSRTHFYFLFFLTFTFFFLNSVQYYIFVQPARYAQDMIYGTRELVSLLTKPEYHNKNIIVSRRLSEPHIYFAFYNSVDPHVVQYSAQHEWSDYTFKTHGWVDQLPQYSLESYTFTSIDWQRDKYMHNVLLAGKAEDFPHGFSPLETIYNPNGIPAFFIVDPTAEQNMQL